MTTRLRGTVEEVEPGLFYVWSYTTIGMKYIVDTRGAEGPRCTCPAFTYRPQKGCKHLRAVSAFMEDRTERSGQCETGGTPGQGSGTTGPDPTVYDDSPWGPTR